MNIIMLHRVGLKGLSDLLEKNFSISIYKCNKV